MKPDIKGWRERAALPPDYKLYCPSAVERALLEEVAELRERLNFDEPKPKERGPRQFDLIEATMTTEGERKS